MEHHGGTTAGGAEPTAVAASAGASHGTSPSAVAGAAAGGSGVGGGGASSSSAPQSGPSGLAGSSPRFLGSLLDQSPTARLSKAPSDPPSEFSSWHDDASSSLATLNAGDRTITVNTQRMRMGDHLRGKLQGMIRQRFENYLRIVQTLQNETGKLAVLECELLVPARGDDEAPVRISISCNEDETFLAYLAPDVSDMPGPGSQASDSASCGGSDGHGEASGCSSPGARNGDTPPATASSELLPTAAPAAGAAAPAADSRALLKRWIAQVCEFGMSGRCHSLTALFHFGYTAWKQLLGNARVPAGYEVPEGSMGNGRSSGGLWCAGGMLPEEEERRPEEKEEDEQNSARAGPAVGVSPSPQLGDTAAASADEPAPSSSSKARPEQTSFAAEPRPLAHALHAAQCAAACDRLHQALELCNEGIVLIRSAAGAAGSSFQASGGGASSSSSAPPQPQPQPPTSLDLTSGADGDIDATSARWQLLLLRASVQAQLSSYSLALADAEDLISLQPTCAEGYYWQSVALQGLGRGQEALEALMSALEYEPQNSLFQQAFTSLFEEISAASEGGRQSPRSLQGSPAVAPGDSASSAAAAPALPRRPARSSGGWPRGPRDALSTTTQATHLSSRSTTPTEVSEPLSRSSSNDSLSIAGAADAA